MILVGCHITCHILPSSKTSRALYKYFSKMTTGWIPHFSLPRHTTIFPAPAEVYLTIIFRACIQGPSFNQILLVIHIYTNVCKTATLEKYIWITSSLSLPLQCLGTQWRRRIYKPSFVSLLKKISRFYPLFRLPFVTVIKYNRDALYWFLNLIHVRLPL